MQNNIDLISDLEKGRKILIVEDDRIEQELLSKRVRGIADGVCIDIIDSARKFTSNENYDLVILDLNINDCFGPQTVKDFRRYVANSPVVVITSIASDLTVKECEKNGADHFFLKHELSGDGFKNVVQKHLA